MAAQQPALVSILLDGKPLEPKYYTSDMNDKGNVLIKDSRMYDILDLKGDDGRHILTLQVPENVSFYVFTFGSETK